MVSLALLVGLWASSDLWARNSARNAGHGGAVSGAWTHNGVPLKLYGLDKPQRFTAGGEFWCEPLVEQNIDGDTNHWRLKAECHVKGGDGTKKNPHQLCAFEWDSKTQKATVLARQTGEVARHEQLPANVDASQFKTYRLLQSRHDLPGTLDPENLVRDMHMWTGLKCGTADRGPNLSIAYVDSNPVEALDSGWPCEFRSSQSHGRETSRAYLCSDPDSGKSCQYLVDRTRNRVFLYEEFGRVENRSFDAAEPAPVSEARYDRTRRPMRISNEDFHNEAYNWLNENCGS